VATGNLCWGRQR